MGGLDGPPKPPALGSAPAEPWRSSGSRAERGPRRASQAPCARKRPGGAVALLRFARGVVVAILLGCDVVRVSGASVLIRGSRVTPTGAGSAPRRQRARRPAPLDPPP